MLGFSCFLSLSWAAEKSTTQQSATQQPDIYVQLPVFVIPVIQDRHVKAIYTLTLIIELNSAKDKDQVTFLKPRIVNGILMDLYGIFAIVWEPYKQVQLLDIKKRLIRMAKKIAGDNAIKDILVQQFQSQQMPASLQK